LAPGLGKCATHQGDPGEGRERGLDGQSPDRSGSTGADWRVERMVGMLGMLGMVGMDHGE